MAKKQTEEKILPPKDSAESLTAPALSEDLLKELAQHTKANQQGGTSAPQLQPAEGTPQERTTDDNLPMIIEQPESTSVSSQERTSKEKDPLDDEKTDAAVDEILQEESDEVLAAEDASQKPPETPKPRGFWAKIGHFFAAWWHNKWARSITILVILLAVAAVAAFPQSRYLVLNKAGVRSSMSLAVVDNGTRLPLKNVTVSIGGKSAKTDSEGVAKISGITLGKHTVSISRIAFAKIEQPVVIGWGSNPLGDFILEPTGVRYKITVTDYISGKPITGAEAVSDDESVTAVSDKKGVIILTFENTDALTANVTIRAKDYRDTATAIRMESTDQTVVSMVPAQKVVYVSRQTGKYDLISMYVDGQDKKTLLAGTGNENNNVGLVVSPDAQAAAMVSTRDNVRDHDGYLLSTLMIVNVDKSLPITVTHAEQIQLVTWSGNQLVFVETSAGASAANPNRYRLIAYDYTTNKRTILATANQFNGMANLGGFIYYAVSSTDPNTQAKFYRVKLDGTGRQTVFDKEIWTVVRSAYDTLQLQTPDGWYKFTVDGTLQKIDNPGQFTSRSYIAGPKTLSAWVDSRDGQGVLLTYDSASKKDTTVKMQNGLTYPIRWLNSTTLIYRVANNQEVADYAIGVDGGQAKKISDVTNTFGFTY